MYEKQQKQGVGNPKLKLKMKVRENNATENAKTYSLRFYILHSFVSQTCWDEKRV
jgi:hypothetical protein